MNETPHEFEFWDRFFRIGKQGDAKPYFNPVTLRLAEAGFPHSNSATIRKNTFANKWKAAERSDDGDDEVWTLADNYADIVREKVLSKGSDIARAPVVDLAVVMFRHEEFDDAADTKALEVRFRSEFPQRDADYEKIFVFHQEDPAGIFEDAAVSQDHTTAIMSALVADVRTSAALPEAESPPAEVEVEDPVLVQVQQLLALGTSGIILVGSPGTGKSYYAKRIAGHLVQNPAEDIFRVQFHPSYGYEDFVEGYRPDQAATSGYTIVEKTFLRACARASSPGMEGKLVVLIVDEINRGDPARVFGEILTYIERTYRGDPFILPFSGRTSSVPPNLVMIGTMNPNDRSIAQVDAAFVRRFDQIEISPSREVAESLLEASGGFTPEQVDLIGRWFDSVQRLAPFGIGHSFFADIRSVEHLKLVWRYRMRPTAAQAIELNDGAMDDLSASFDALIRRLEGAPGDA